MRVLLVALLVLVSGCATRPDIRLRVEGSGTTDRLTYAFPDQPEQTLRNPAVPWERHGALAGKVSIRMEGVSGELTCKIIINGRQVRTSTSTSGQALTCTHSMAD